MESITKFLDPHLTPEATGEALDVDKALADKGDIAADSDTIEINISNADKDKPKVNDVVLPAEKETETSISDLVDTEEKTETTDSEQPEDSDTEETAQAEKQEAGEEAVEKDSGVEDKTVEEPVKTEPVENETDAATETPEKESNESVETGVNAEPENDSTDNAPVDQENAEQTPDEQISAEQPNPEVDHGESDLDVDPQQPAPLLKLLKEYDFHSTKIYETPNGAKLVYVNKPSELCYCSFEFKVGSYYEDDSNRGISHLLEHLMFNGCPGMSSLEFNEKMDRLGMSVNAFTSRLVTAYHFSGLKSNFISAFELYINLIKSFTATQEIVDKERGVVLNEIGVKDDNNWYVLDEAINSQVYRQHPVANPVIGYEDVIKNISVDQVKTWYTKNYNSKNLTVYLIGEFPEEDLVFVADKIQSFSDGEKNADPVITDTMVLPLYHNVITHKEGAVQTLINSSIVFKNEAYNYFELEILADILGATMSSYLWEQFREVRSIAYQVSADTDSLDPAHLVIQLYAGLNDSSDAELAKSLFKDAFQYAKAVSEEEFNKGLNIQQVALLKSEETEQGLIDLVRDALYYKFELDEFVSMYKNLTYDSYQAFAENINPDNMVTGILYPLAV